MKLGLPLLSCYLEAKLLGKSHILFEYLDEKCIFQKVSTCNSKLLILASKYVLFKCLILPGSSLGLDDLKTKLKNPLQ